MKAATILLLGTMVATAHGQWNVPVNVVLDGATDADRQITGLADPLTPDAGVSLGAARAQAMNFTSVTGTSVLAGDLTPAPAAYTTGMFFTIVPTEANAPGATLALNGLEAMPVVRGTGQPLDSADLAIGSPARLLFNGEHFVVVSNLPRPCRTGSRLLSADLCIEETPREAEDFVEAVRTCTEAGGRLCRFADWVAACRKFPDLLSTAPVAEWVDSSANNANTAKLVGEGSDGLGGEGPGCNFGKHAPPTTPQPFRCCMDR